MVILRAVLCKASKWLLVVALSATLGFHWGVLQSVAWLGMIVNYSRDGSVAEAVSKTFDGQHPCPLCKLVREGKKSEKKTESRQIVKKIDLFNQPCAAFDFPAALPSTISFPIRLDTRADVPPLPPPRAFLG